MVNEEDRKKFAERLKFAIKRSGKTQTQICRETGISNSSLSGYMSKNRKSLPNQKYVYLLSQSLNVNPAWLLGYDVGIENEETLLERIIKKLEKLDDETLKTIDALIELTIK